MDTSVAAWLSGKSSRPEPGIVVGAGRRNPNASHGRKGKR